VEYGAAGEPSPEHAEATMTIAATMAMSARI
jgi:hypothetical protein